MVNVIDEIPGSHPSHVLAALEALDRRIGGDLRAILSGTLGGFRGSHGRILDLIPTGGTRPSSLASGAWITKQAVGKRIAELQELGWVSVSTDPSDGRAVVVRRTAAGDRVRRVAVEGIDAMEDGWADAVGRERYETFRAVLAELGGPVQRR